MYLRETKRRRKDGSEVRYLQLAHNVRHPERGRSTATGQRRILAALDLPEPPRYSDFAPTSD